MQDENTVRELLHEQEIRLREEHLVAIERIKIQIARTEQATQHQLANLRELLGRQDALRSHLELVLETPSLLLARVAHQAYGTYRRALGYHQRCERPWWHFGCRQCDPLLGPWEETPASWRDLITFMVTDLKQALQERAESFQGELPDEVESPPRRTDENVLS